MESRVPEAFTQLLDRGLAADAVTIAQWCPTMDLLALVTAGGGQLHVHRLNWQRLWWTSPESSITAVTWRHDGKQIALGLEDGSLLLLNTEDGDVIRKVSGMLTGTISAMVWCQSACASSTTAQASTLEEDRVPVFFYPQKLGGDTPRPLNYTALGKRAPSHWTVESDRLSLLTVVSNTHEILICTSNLIRLALLTACDAIQGEVIKVSMAPSLHQLAVAWKSSEGMVGLTSFDVSFISQHERFLHIQTKAAAAILQGLEDCQSIWNKSCKTWEAASGKFKTAMQDSILSLFDLWGASGSTPSSELLDLLLTGESTPLMQHFLGQKLAEDNVHKKLPREVDNAIIQVHSNISGDLLPALELLIFRLGELRGLASCRGKVLGLHVKDIEAAEQEATALMIYCVGLRERVVHIGASYRMFFSWLVAMKRKLELPSENADLKWYWYSTNHLEIIRTFLNTEFKADSLGAVLQVVPSLEEAGGGAGDMNSVKIEKMEDLVQRALDNNELCIEEEVVNGMVRLNDTIRVALGRLVEVVTPKIRPLYGQVMGQAVDAKEDEHILCLSIYQDQEKQSGQMQDEEEAGGLSTSQGATTKEVCLMIYQPRDQPQHLRAVKVNEEGRIEHSSTLFHPTAAIVDVDCYKNGRLAFIVQNHEECECALMIAAEADLHGDISLHTQSRVLPYATVQKPLAVSATRGVGCVLNGAQRILLFDLEENEEIEEEEEEEEGGAMQMATTP